MVDEHHMAVNAILKVTMEIVHRDKRFAQLVKLSLKLLHFSTTRPHEAQSGQPQIVSRVTSSTAGATVVFCSGPFRCA
jgi:hypothetical protein